ncbi:MAG: hypothetical protein CL824_00165 [Crocinitomicaceae bacterium]|nr:hypothetical protein [Crocinitomicaceae bacterium]
MNKYRLNIIVISLAVSIISLFIIQAYQTSQIYDRKLTQFNTNRSTSLERITIRHEKAEDIRRYMKIIKNDFQLEYQSVLKKEFRKLFETKDASIHDTLIDLNGTINNYLIVEGTSIDSLGNSKEEKVITRDIYKVEELFNYNIKKIPPRDSIKTSIELNQQVLQEIFKKAKTVNDMMFRTFPDSVKNANQREVNILFLDSIVKSEIADDDLPKNYSFMIVNHKGKPLKYKEDIKNYSSSLNKKKCGKTKLYPSDILSNNLWLYIYFPDKNTYIFDGMKTSLYVTLLLVILVGLSLFFMYKTILLQKRFTELRTDFISNMTHEFKTPISTIALACEALGDDDVISEEDKNNIAPYVNMIDAENKRLSKLVDGILQSAIMMKGKMELENENTNINELVRNISNQFSFRINSLNGSLNINILDKEYYHSCDKLHLTNAISNLIDNAIKYSSESLVIDISLIEADGELKLIIKDQGIGIKKEHLPRIFDKLYRVPTGNIHNVKGFGLGLNYAKGIINHYGWEITVNSEFGKGTVFTIIFKNIHDV